MKTRSFEAGFILGQTSVYIEQVTTGAKLAAQLGCSSYHLQDVLSTVSENGCLAMTEDRGHGRVAIWIFRHPFVSTLIQQLSLDAAPPTAAGVWSMGKLFGYADLDIEAYLQANKLIS